MKLEYLQVGTKLSFYHDDGTPSLSLCFAEVIQLGKTQVKVRDEFGNEAWKDPSFFDGVVSGCTYNEIMRERAKHRPQGFVAFEKPARIYDFDDKDFGAECDRQLDLVCEVIKAYKMKRRVPCHFQNGMYQYNNAYAYALALMYDAMGEEIPVGAH